MDAAAQSHTLTFEDQSTGSKVTGTYTITVKELSPMPAEKANGFNMTGPQTLAKGKTGTVTYTVDPTDAKVTLELVGTYPGLTYDAGKNTLTAADDAQVGTQTLTFKDTKTGLTSELAVAVEANRPYESFDVTVPDVAPGKSVKVEIKPGSGETAQPEAKDLVLKQPVEQGITYKDGQLTVPDGVKEGSYEVTFIDTKTGEEKTVTVKVVAPAVTLAVAGPAEATQGETVTLTFTLSNGGTPAPHCAALPTGFTQVGNQLVISVDAAAQSHTLTFEDQSTGATLSATYTLTVKSLTPAPSNAATEFTVTGPRQLAPGSQGSVTYTVKPAGAEVELELVGTNPGLSYDKSTRTLTAAPDAAQGVHTLTFKDGKTGRTAELKVEIVAKQPYGSFTVTVPAVTPGSTVPVTVKPAAGAAEVPAMKDLVLQPPVAGITYDPVTGELTVAGDVEYPKDYEVTFVDTRTGETTTVTVTVTVFHLTIGSLYIFEGDSYQLTFEDMNHHGQLTDYKGLVYECTPRGLVDLPKGSNVLKANKQGAVTVTVKGPQLAGGQQTFKVYVQSYSTPNAVASLLLSDLQVFPNPVTDVLWLRNAEHVRWWGLYNALGQLLYESSASGDPVISYDMQGYAAGFYLLLVRDEAGNSRTLRFMRMR